MILPEINPLDRFEVWLTALDEICQTEMGISYQDLPDQHFRDWFHDGMRPEDAYYQMIEKEYPGVDVQNIYYQEFDCFTDADPGL